MRKDVKAMLVKSLLTGVLAFILGFMLHEFIDVKGRMDILENEVALTSARLEFIENSIDELEVKVDDY